MKLSIETSVYNEKRYGKPYIAVVDFSESAAKPNIKWGEWIGTPGYAGILEIDAQPGDIIMRGQKDNRGNNSAPLYYVVSDEGELQKIGYNRADAYKQSIK